MRVSRALTTSGLFMTLVAVANGALGYIFQILMGRNLSPQEFALFGALMAVTVFFVSPFHALSTIIVREIASTLVLRDRSSIWPKYVRMGAALFVLGLALLVVSLIGANYFTTLVAGSQSFEFFLIALCINGTIFGMLNNAFLQGAKEFKHLALSGLATVTLKIFISVTLVTFGFGVIGALTGVAASVILVNVFIFSIIRTIFKNQTGYENLESPDTAFNMSKFFPILFAHISLALITQLDVFLINNIFESEIAGAVAVAAVLAKAILYLPSGIVLVLLPMVAESTPERSHLIRLLTTSLVLVLSMSLLATIFYWLFGHLIVDLLFGAAYTNAGDILGYYSLAMVPLAVVVSMEYFLMARGYVVYAWLTTVFAPIEIALLMHTKSNVLNFVAIIGLSNLILMIFGGVVTYILLFKK